MKKERITLHDNKDGGIDIIENKEVLIRVFDNQKSYLKLAEIIKESIATADDFIQVSLYELKEEIKNGNKENSFDRVREIRKEFSNAIKGISKKEIIKKEIQEILIEEVKKFAWWLIEDDKTYSLHESIDNTVKEYFE